MQGEKRKDFATLLGSDRCRGRMASEVAASLGAADVVARWLVRMRPVGDDQVGSRLLPMLARIRLAADPLRGTRPWRPRVEDRETSTEDAVLAARDGNHRRRARFRRRKKNDRVQCGRRHGTGNEGEKPSVGGL